MVRVALILSAIADTATMLLPPLGAELNPLAATNPGLAVALKCGLAALLLAWPWRYAVPLRVIAASAWTVGALSNALVLLGG